MVFNELLIIFWFDFIVFILICCECKYYFLIWFDNLMGMWIVLLEEIIIKVCYESFFVCEFYIFNVFELIMWFGGKFEVIDSLLFGIELFLLLLFLMYFLKWFICI